MWPAIKAHIATATAVAAATEIADVNADDDGEEKQPRAASMSRTQPR